MRRVFCALMLLGMASPATAGDFDLPPPSAGTNYVAPLDGAANAGYLRGTVGPATFTRWSGFYFGGDVGYGYMQSDFSGATEPLLAFSLRELVLQEVIQPSQWPVLGTGITNAITYGGFLGYNTQWQDLVLGVEGNYTHTSLNAVATVSPIGYPPSTTSPSRIVSAGGYTYNVGLTGTGRLDLTDYGEARARAGYIIGNFLPYGFAGLVIGGASYSVTASANVTQSTLTPPFPCTFNNSTCQNFIFSNSTGQTTALLYGFSAGAGLDWALTPNVFLRGEFEFVQFAPISNITTSLVKASIGAGVKF